MSVMGTWNLRTCSDEDLKKQAMEHMRGNELLGFKSAFHSVFGTSNPNEFSHTLPPKSGDCCPHLETLGGGLVAALLPVFCDMHTRGFEAAANAGVGGGTRDCCISGLCHIPSCTAGTLLQDLWVCLTCMFVGCSRFHQAHSLRHFHTRHPLDGHCLAMNLQTAAVWCHGCGRYAGSPAGSPALPTECDFVAKLQRDLRDSLANIGWQFR
jgi:hypothetical protein